MNCTPQTLITAIFALVNDFVSPLLMFVLIKYDSLMILIDVKVACIKGSCRGAVEVTEQQSRKVHSAKPRRPEAAGTAGCSPSNAKTGSVVVTQIAVRTKPRRPDSIRFSKLQRPVAVEITLVLLMTVYVPLFLALYALHRGV